MQFPPCSNPPPHRFPPAFQHRSAASNPGAHQSIFVACPTRALFIWNVCQRTAFFSKSGDLCRAVNACHSALVNITPMGEGAQVLGSASRRVCFLRLWCSQKHRCSLGPTDDVRRRFDFMYGRTSFIHFETFAGCFCSSTLQLFLKHLQGIPSTKSIIALGTTKS